MTFLDFSYFCGGMWDKQEKEVLIYMQKKSETKTC